MYFTLSPSFYYMVNKPSIQDYLSIELHGDLPYNVNKDKFILIITKYIINNSNGVNINNINDYVEYICGQLLLDSWNK